MAMMYQKIGEALRDSGLSSHPTDWLLFMCPGKREEPGPHLDQLQVPSDPLAQVRTSIVVVNGMSKLLRRFA